MTPTRISFCIPTHNFGRFIGDAIESVCAQYRPGTEIVILDGASTDGTRDEMGRYQATLPYLSYHYQPFKGGIDADIMRCIALAKGDYCWLLSADDALAEGALARIWEEIKRGCDVYLCNRVLCDKDLSPQGTQSWLSGEAGDERIILDDDKALGRYFDRASSIGALFSYMSTIIVKRESWNRAAPDGALTGTNYAHVHRLFSMRSFGATMGYIAAPLVSCRGSNDSFLSLGLAGRHLIDLCGFQLIAESLFPRDARLRRRFKKVVRREHHWVTWVWLRSVVEDDAEWAKIRGVLPHYGYGGLTILAMELLARLPHGVTLAHMLRNAAVRIRQRLSSK